MITFNMQLIPFGSMLYGEHELVKGVIHTSVDHQGNDVHKFFILDNDNKELFNGSIRKEYSGHKNPLKTLKNILDSIDIEGLKKDHVKTVWDLPADQRMTKKQETLRLESLRDELRRIVDMIEDYSYEGEEGRSCLETILEKTTVALEKHGVRNAG